MKKLLFAVCCWSFITVSGQEGFDGHKWEAPYLLPIPNDWGVERFLLPPAFAPQITYKGVEDIRFTPGWGNAKSEEYWSYTFLWYLDENPQLNKTSLERYLKAYYTGLLKINTDSSKYAGEKPIPVITRFKPAKPLPQDTASYTGTVRMRDYMTRQPITLHCRMHATFCKETGKTIYFFELSPQPFTHIVWKSLDELWEGFRCIKK